MSPRVTLATAARVLSQLRRDPRTVAMLLVLPSLLIALLGWVFVDQPQTLDRIGAPLLGVFPFVVMFLVTSIVALRERVTGTLERLLSMPLRKLDLLVGYALAFGVVATLQAALASAVALGLFDIDVRGPVAMVVVVAVADALLGMALGLAVSAWARTEFQAVQFMPAIVLPQFLVCGLLVPRDQLPPVLEAVSAVLPLSYAVDAMNALTTETGVGSDVAVGLAVVVASVLAALALGAATLQRRTA